MSTELATEAWRLPELTAEELGPYGDFERFTDAEKAAVWEAYRAGRPTRVPVTLGTNNRVFLLDERFDAEGLNYERAFGDARAMLIAQLRWQYICRRRYGLLCDLPSELPEKWEVGVDTQNVYEAAYFGAPIHFHDRGQPETTPILNDDNKRAIFDVDIDRPTENPFFARMIALAEQMRELAAGATFFGRPIVVQPFAALGTDGPLTVAMNLRGPAILADLKRDPAYARELFDFIVTAGVKRYHAFVRHSSWPAPSEAWHADDSIALLSAAQYREFVLPYHRKWYDGVDPRREKRRGMHLCGDATRHFASICDECGVTAFDTGFPVDFGWLRGELGPEVEIAGGVEAPMLMSRSPDEVYERTKAILESGVLRGGRFILREGNNLPPNVPWANLAAMYKAGIEGKVTR